MFDDRFYAFLIPGAHIHEKYAGCVIMKPLQLFRKVIHFPHFTLQSGLNRVNSLTIIIFLFLRYHTGIVTSSKTVITEENGLKRSPENLYPMLVSGWILRITVTVILLRVWRGT